MRRAEPAELLAFSNCIREIQSAMVAPVNADALVLKAGTVERAGDFGPDVAVPVAAQHTGYDLSRCAYLLSDRVHSSPASEDAADLIGT